MDTIAIILAVVSQGARTVTTESDPEVEAAYRNVTAIIRQMLDIGREAHATESDELYMAVEQDPVAWHNPVIANALRSLPRNNVREIRNATRILAARLPGETPILPDDDDE